MIQELFETLQQAGLKDASVQALKKKYGVWRLWGEESHGIGNYLWMHLLAGGEELFLGQDHAKYSHGTEADPEIAC